MGNAGHCACGGGCLRGLRRADWQGSKEETQQKVVGGYRGCGICGRDSGDHSDRPDTNAPLIGRGLNNTPPEILVSGGVCYSQSVGFWKCAYARVPFTGFFVALVIQIRKMKLNSKRFCLGDLIPFDFS